MKKSELIDAIQAERPGCTKSDIQRVLEGLTLAAATAIAKGEDFAIPGVVRLTVKDQAARQGRNPATGESIEISARRAVKATVAGQLKSVVN